MFSDNFVSLSHSLGHRQLHIKVAKDELTHFVRRSVSNKIRSVQLAEPRTTCLFIDESTTIGCA